ncbi:MAG: hypothetical protein V7L05_18480 [Nostoc sp.]
MRAIPFLFILTSGFLSSALLPAILLWSRGAIASPQKTTSPLVPNLVLTVQ